MPFSVVPLNKQTDIYSHEYKAKHSLTAFNAIEYPWDEGNTFCFVLVLFFSTIGACLHGLN